jgi:amino acid adenylation domain-containing protein
MLTTDLLKDGDINFIKLFQNQVNKDSGKCAIVFQDKELTYGQLDLYSNKIAHMIKKNNVNQESVILLLSNPLSQISAMLGVLKSGLCYIPLDPSYPEETNETIIKDSCAKLILTEDTQLSLLKKVDNTGMNILSLKDAEHYSLDNFNKKIAHDDNSYILYTSGSTGNPKGVVHNHRNLLHVITVYCEDLQIEEWDRFSYLYSYSFSAGLKDVVAPLSCGATIYPYSIKKEGIKGLITYLRNNQITVYHSVPTVFRHLCDELKEGECFPHLRLISLGSEAITNKDIQLYTKYFADNSRLHIEYGITEAGVITQNFIDKNIIPQIDRLPVGSPIFGKDVSILDDTDNPVKSNEIGEIVVKSAYIAKGYWKQGNLNVLKVSHFQDGLEIKVFKTGDIGRWCDKGVLEHLGRKDNQIKIHGHKVNIAELEIILNNLDLIDEAIVLSKEDKAGDNSLIAFVVLCNDNEQNLLSLIREQLKQRIPEYMIPARFIKLYQIPKLPNGKTDRQKLISELEELKEEKKVYSNDTIEQAIALIYADILDTKNFTVNDSIFALGASSIKVSQVCSIIEDLFKIDFPVTYIFNYPSVAGLAKHLIEREEHNVQLKTQAQQFIEMGGRVMP